MTCLCMHKYIIEEKYYQLDSGRHERGLVGGAWKVWWEKREGASDTIIFQLETFFKRCISVCACFCV